MKQNPPDYAFVVRKSDEYLCDRFHHRPWSKALMKATLFLTQKTAEEAAIRHQGTIVMVELKEIIEFVELETPTK